MCWAPSAHSDSGRRTFTMWRSCQPLFICSGLWHIIWNRVAPDQIYDSLRGNKPLSIVLYVVLLGILLYTGVKGISKGIEKISNIMVPALFILFIITFCCYGGNDTGYCRRPELLSESGFQPAGQSGTLGGSRGTGVVFHRLWAPGAAAGIWKPYQGAW